MQPIPNINQGQITKRPPRLNRKRFARGDLSANSLGSIQPQKKPPAYCRNGHFQCLPRKHHEHTWLFGTDNAVCSLCGYTVPKAQIQNPQAS